MQNVPWALPFVTCLLGAAAAAAEPAPSSRELAARVGARALGEYDEHGGSTIAGGGPGLELQAGWRVSPALSFGALGSLGWTYATSGRYAVRQLQATVGPVLDLHFGAAHVGASVGLGTDRVTLEDGSRWLRCWDLALLSGYTLARRDGFAPQVTATLAATVIDYTYSVGHQDQVAATAQLSVGALF